MKVSDDCQFDSKRSNYRLDPIKIPHGHLSARANEVGPEEEAEPLQAYFNLPNRSNLN